MISKDHRRGLERAMEICQLKIIEASSGERYWVKAEDWQRAENKKICKLVLQGLSELILDELQKGVARDGKASNAKRGR